MSGSDARPASPAQANAAAAYALVGALVDAGVRHAVISPGSRSSPLVLACEAFPVLQTWVMVDERAAAFFALGLSKSGGQPVAVIATSGSAPAHWFPAVVEAEQDTTPLILLSADRPPDLQDCGANQTIDQTHLFGNHVRAFFAVPEPGSLSSSTGYLTALAARAVDTSRWPRPGPVHLNIPFREPLIDPECIPDAVDFSPPPGSPSLVYPSLCPREQDVERLAGRLSGGRGLIVCGRGHGSSDLRAAVTELATRLQCPVLADPLSGLRYGVPDRSLILSRYDSFLRRHDFAKQFQPDWVLRFGALPVSRVLQAYLAAAGGASQILVTPFHPWPDPDHTAGWVIHSDPVLLCRTLLDSAIQAGDSGWAAAFLAAEQRAAVLEARQELPPEAYILRHIAFACPAGSRIFAGNSMVIRDVDSFWPSDAKDMLIIANRGASGIDGNVATALGIAAASSGRVIALLGDVALYHDMTALANARGLAAILIVFNNGGGGIFEYLPQAGLPQFERYWLTPPALEIGKIADLFEVDYFSADSAPAFAEAFDAALKLDHSSLIEVKVDRPASVALHKDFWAAVSSQPD